MLISVNEGQACNAFVNFGSTPVFFLHMWTYARVYTHAYRFTCKIPDSPTEEIISNITVQYTNVYHKFNSKISTSNIKQYKKEQK